MVVKHSSSHWGALEAHVEDGRLTPGAMQAWQSAPDSRTLRLRTGAGEMADPLPLDGIRVLDLTRARAGPTAVRQLADWGADAVMIEPPVALDISDTMSGPRHGPDYQNLHRNKRSMTLNLKGPEGDRHPRRMVAGGDVLVENYRPDVKHRLGIDYDTSPR